MSWEKIAQSVAQPVYLPKLMHTFSVEKSTPNFLVPSVIFKSLTIENNRPIGENSSNLVIHAEFHQ
jgi:hypothetical protein